MYDGNYLEPQRVALEPLQAEFGYQKFIFDIGWNRANDKIDRKILFAGNIEDWITFEKTLAKPPMSSMLLTIIICCVLSVLTIVMVISRKHYLNILDKQGIPTVDEDSLGECYSYGEPVDKTAEEEEKLKLGANQFETDTEDGKKFRHVFIMKNDDDAEKDDADGLKEESHHLIKLTMKGEVPTSLKMKGEVPHMPSLEMKGEARHLTSLKMKGEARHMTSPKMKGAIHHMIISKAIRLISEILVV
eukprot:CAMPEP_0171305108 /NCGR_PEP_ID=MMETSP0816-20121228/14904_1 /TAXON_ID=420281 /ORGANISM="Proboscia inermis, Strain CCAP1064/1" /LENGTH=245 /DNA_ID=CAMNT_0011785689 /DNA_START=160 /DNA_END=898 /DNA_ORIENTATION=+